MFYLFYGEVGINPTKYAISLFPGCGLILAAHTKEEFNLKRDLETAVRLYVKLVEKLFD